MLIPKFSCTYVQVCHSNPHTRAQNLCLSLLLYCIVEKLFFDRLVILAENVQIIAGLRKRNVLKFFLMFSLDCHFKWALKNMTTKRGEKKLINYVYGLLMTEL